MPLQFKRKGKLLVDGRICHDVRIIRTPLPGPCTGTTCSTPAFKSVVEIARAEG